ncbi:hypothetical protein [Bradyrhizobium yuanmingense]|nr:hypothetical protein [Bradyrhizobium yuanmingense]MDF0492167.1 hypothetical protein [Bradyrhizobium yuanmingense]
MLAAVQMMRMAQFSSLQDKGAHFPPKVLRIIFSALLLPAGLRMILA